MLSKRVLDALREEFHEEFGELSKRDDYIQRAKADAFALIGSMASNDRRLEVDVDDAINGIVSSVPRRRVLNGRPSIRKARSMGDKILSPPVGAVRSSLSSGGRHGQRRSTAVWSNPTGMSRLTTAAMGTWSGRTAYYPRGRYRSHTGAERHCV